MLYLCVWRELPLTPSKATWTLARSLVSSRSLTKRWRGWSAGRWTLGSGRGQTDRLPPLLKPVFTTHFCQHNACLRLWSVAQGQRSPIDVFTRFSARRMPKGCAMAEPPCQLVTVETAKARRPGSELAPKRERKRRIGLRLRKRRR
jgi:hypothetical protein